MNGCPAGLCGEPFPALTSGLVDVGCTSHVAIFVKPGLVPVIVPVHAVGTRADPVGIQLLLPVLTRPATQRTRVSNTTLSIGAPPTRKNTLLCISRLSIPSKISTAGLTWPCRRMNVLFTNR